MVASSRHRNSRKKEDLTSQRSDTPTSQDAEHIEQGVSSNSRDSCPACSGITKIEHGASVRDTWIRCDSCKTWFHWECVAVQGQDHETVDRWYCTTCLNADPAKSITFKPPVRKSSRKRVQRDYASIHAGIDSDPDKWTKFMENKAIIQHEFPVLSGDKLTLEWLNSDENAFREPIIIPSPDGLAMKMPSRDFQVSDVTRILGGETPVEVIDVHTQSSVREWNLEKWNKYYYTEPELRDRIRNVISLEISDTDLASQIEPPRIVREIDWVENYWPPAKRGKGQSYPKVQLYCLMGVARAWTDWHIDFAGSSVYYHILKGVKTFYFIRPTPGNLLAYEKWSGSETQNQVWLGDLVDNVYKVELRQGNTMIIPTGWIHAVHTPEDSLVFGGNFLHSYDVSTQLRVREIEMVTQVPKKFRFPMFVKLCWYVAEKVLHQLRANEELPQRILESFSFLAQFLVSEVRNIERKSAGLRESREMIPVDKVKDAPALARELRWRCRNALGGDSGDDARLKKPNLVNGSGKRKRAFGEAEETTSQDSQKFRHFKPRIWDKVHKTPSTHSSFERRIVKDTPRDQWLNWGEIDEPASGDNDVLATVNSTHNMIIRARQRTSGEFIIMERHKAIQVQEEWQWHDRSKS